MSLLRYNPKRDSEERRLVAELNQRGVTTFPCSASGLPDQWGIFRKRWYAIEIKSGKRGKLTQQQRSFFKLAGHLDAPAYVIRSSADIDLMMQDIASRA